MPPKSNNPSPYKCVVSGCGRSFATYPAFVQHGATHNSRPVQSSTGPATTFRCGISNCERTFSSRQALGQHRATHNNHSGRSPQGQAPTHPNAFKCGVVGCGRSFATDQSLIQHHGNTHKPAPSNNSQNPSSTNAVLCKSAGCKRRFATREDMQRHFSDSHPNEIKHAFKCGVPNCGQSFKALAQLQEHTSNLHPRPAKVVQQRTIVQMKPYPIYIQSPAPNLYGSYPHQVPVAEGSTSPRASSPTSPKCQTEYKDSVEPTEPKVYKRLALLLERKLQKLQKLGKLGKLDTSIVDRFRTLVDNMRSKDDVSSLAASSRYRICLQELSNKVKCELIDVREAIKLDDDDICHLLASVIGSVTKQERVLSLRGEEAQDFLDFLRNIRIQPTPTVDAREIERLSLKLSKTCGLFSTSLILEGVKLDGDGSPVASGGFADIFKGKYDGKDVALKRLNLRASGQDVVRKRLMQEVALWDNLNHAFVLPFLGLDSINFPMYLPCIVTPWMRNRTILHYIRNNAIPRPSIDRLVHETARGLAYLHSKQITHGDLRGVNVLVDDEGHARLADFGLASFADATQTHSSSYGSTRWMAPELFCPDDFGLERRRRTEASDVYSLAILYWEIYAGGEEPPYPDKNEFAVLYFVVQQQGRPSRPPPESGMSNDLWCLIEQCWAHEPVDRPDMKKVLECMKSMDFGVETE